MKTSLRLFFAAVLVFVLSGATAASAATAPGSTLSQGQISACLTPPASQTAQQTQAACVSVLQILVALVLQLTQHSASTPVHGTTVATPALPAPSNNPVVVAPHALGLEIATSTLDSVKLLFYAMPPQTRIILVDPVTGAQIPGSGFSMLEAGSNGSVVFPMAGEFAGRSFAFRAESSSTKQLIALSSVFTVPKPAGNQELGTFDLLDGQVLLASFPGITYANADTRCKTEKAQHPTRNTRCLWNGASFDF